MPQQLSHRVLIHRIPGQIVGLAIAFQQSLPLQETADAVRKGVGQAGHLSIRRRLQPAKPQQPIRSLDVHAVEKQHVEVNVELQSAAEALDQGDRACPGCVAGKPSLLDQVRGNASVDNAEHLAHDGRAAGEQET